MEKKNILIKYNNVMNYYNNRKKTKILVYPVKIEYEYLSMFLSNSQIMKSFINRNMYNVCAIPSFPYYNKNEKNDLKSFVLISKNIDKKTDFYNYRVVYSKHYINHSAILIRFFIEDFENKIEKDTNDNFFYVEICASLYKNNEDNSSVLINEISTILSDTILNKFYMLVHYFYQRLEKFFRKRLDDYFCYESIYIQKSMMNVINYLYSSKIFSNKKIKLISIKKNKEIIEFTFEISKFITDKKSILKFSIINISTFSCLISINDTIKIENIYEQIPSLKIKSIIKFLIKRLRQKIYAE